MFSLLFYDCFNDLDGTTGPQTLVTFLSLHPVLGPRAVTFGIFPAKGVVDCVFMKRAPLPFRAKQGVKHVPEFSQGARLTGVNSSSS